MSELEKRFCALEECNKDISELHFNTKYCCKSHSNLHRIRKFRKKNKEATPYITTGEICPIDGRVFPVELFNKPGRPKKYDCISCSNIAKKIREVLKYETGQ